MLWRKKNKDREKIRAARYFRKRWKDPSFRAYRYEKVTQWRKRNRKRSLLLAKRDRQKHHARVMWHNRYRELVEKEVRGSHTNHQWVELKRKYGNKCACCGAGERKVKLTRDHVVPITRGGSDNIENIQPLCQSCNSKKHTRRIRYEWPSYNV